MPRLTKFFCGDNRLTTLDLRSVPRLTELYCDDNELTELDLSPVPGLKILHCDHDVRCRNAPTNVTVTRPDDDAAS